MKGLRDIMGYVIGFMLFVVLVPLLMWSVSGEVSFGGMRACLFLVLALGGLALSVWSLTYLRRWGEGNPLDAFDHEVGTRSKTLLTKGPYALCRNPMLLGVLIYYLGLLILLSSIGAVLVFVVFVGVMAVQVRSEERRLARDFKEVYREYAQATKRLLPFIW